MKKNPQINWNPFTFLPAVPALILAVVIVFPNLHKPFVGHHDWNGVQYGNIARNYLRYGYINSKLGQIENSGIINSQHQFSFNTHHPSTFPILLSFVINALGISEFSLRIFPFMMSLIGLICISSICNAFWGKFTATLAPILWVLTPMFGYFSSMPVHEPVISTISLAMFLSYVRWRFYQGPLKWVFIFHIINISLGWPGYYVAPIIIGVDILLFRKWNMKLILPLVITSIFSFIIHLTHTYILTGNMWGGGLLRVLLFRLNIGGFSQHPYQYTLTQFIQQEALWVRAFFSNTVFFLAIIYLSICVYLFVKNKYSHTHVITAALIIFGATHAIVFNNAAYIHDYMIYYLGPGMIIAASGVIHQIGKISEKYIPLASFKLVLFLTTIFLVYGQTKDFTDALWKTNMHEIGMQVGLEIKSISYPDQNILLPSQIFAMHFGKFTNFYADRNIISNQEEMKNIDHLVLVKGQPLESKYDLQLFKEGNYIYYKKVTP